MQTVHLGVARERAGPSAPREPANGLAPAGLPSLTHDPRCRAEWECEQPAVALGPAAAPLLRVHRWTRASRAAGRSSAR
jgi:hypothetical protein